MKQLRNRLAVTLVLAFAAYVHSAAQTNPEELLQSGVYKEEVEGEIEDAIEIFEQIIAEHAQNRSVTARALLHLGSSYEKLGNMKAEDAYQRLIKEYGDQQTIVSEARMRLQKMRYRELAEGIQSRSGSPTYRIALDKEAPEIRVMAARQYDFSPDGSQVVYQGEGGLFVSDASGTLHRQLVAEPDGWKEWSVNFFRVGQARWSPDGKQIVYFASKPKPPGDDYNDPIFTIFVIEPDGGAARKVVEFLDPEPYGGLNWTPDGKAVTYLSMEGVQVLDLEGKTIKLIEIEGGRKHQSTRLTELSPDGRWLAFQFKADLETGNNRDTDVYIVPASGGAAVQLTFASGFDGNPAWSKDNRTVYFVSGREAEGENSNIWRIGVDQETGEPIGDPEQVTFFDDATIVNPQIVGAGQHLAFLLGKTKHSIQVAPEDRPEERRTLARGVHPQITPDGGTIYYVGEGPDNQGIFSVSTDGAEQKRVSSLAPLVDQKDLSPDGKYLTYFATLDSERGLYVHPLEGGEPILLVKTGCDECCTSPRWSPDGKSIAYAYLDGIFVIPSTGGLPKQLATLRKWEAWTLRWSPDGQHIAALGYPEAQGNNAVYVLPSTGGKLRLLGNLDNYKEGLEWHPDSRSLTFHLSEGKSATARVWLDGKPQEEFLDNPKAWDYLGKWAPDGKRFFFLSYCGEEGFLDIYDTESEEITHFAENPHMDMPEWSQDSKMITWTSENSVRQLWLMEDFK